MSDGPELPPDIRPEIEFDTLMPDWVGWTIASVLLVVCLIAAVVMVVTVWP